MDKVKKIEKEIEEAKVKFGIGEVVEGQIEESEKEMNFFEEIEKEYGKLIINGKINGESEIVFQTSFTGKQLATAKAKYEREKKGKGKILAELDDEYFLIVAEMMTGIKADIFQSLHAIDTRKVITHVRNFLGE